MGNLLHLLLHFKWSRSWRKVGAFSIVKKKKKFLFHFLLVRIFKSAALSNPRILRPSKSASATSIDSRTRGTTTSYILWPDNFHVRSLLLLLLLVTNIWGIICSPSSGRFPTVRASLSDARRLESVWAGGGTHSCYRWVLLLPPPPPPLISLFFFARRDRERLVGRLVAQLVGQSLAGCVTVKRWFRDDTHRFLFLISTTSSNSSWGSGTDWLTLGLCAKCTSQWLISGVVLLSCQCCDDHRGDSTCPIRSSVRS